MQTMESMENYKQIKIASETLYIYAPLAHRLGLYNIKTQLEDLGLKYTEPPYNDIVSKIKETKDQQDAYIKISLMIKASLDAEGVEYVMTPKINLFHQKKMLNQNVLMKSMTSLRFASFTKRIRTMKISGLENIFYCN
jgi:GTP pyrophosphokinase